MSTSTPQSDATRQDSDRAGSYTDPREPGFLNAVWKSIWMFAPVTIISIIAIVLIAYFLFWR